MARYWGKIVVPIYFYGLIIWDNKTVLSINFYSRAWSLHAEITDLTTLSKTAMANVGRPTRVILEKQHRTLNGNEKTVIEALTNIWPIENRQ